MHDQHGEPGCELQRWTIEVTERKVRRYVLDAHDEQTAMRLAESPLAELSDVSRRASWEYLIDRAVTSQIVSV